MIKIPTASPSICPIQHTSHFDHTQTLSVLCSSSGPGQPPQPFQLACNPTLPCRNSHSLSCQGSIPHCPWPSLCSSGFSSPALEMLAGKLLLCFWPLALTLQLRASRQLPLLLPGLQPYRPGSLAWGCQPANSSTALLPSPRDHI